MALARVLRALGITGWRRHVQIRIPDIRMRREGSKARSSGGSAAGPLKVRPDFVFRAQRVTVFVDECFWHGCPRHATWPKQNGAFWREKLEGNRSRDRRVNRALRRAGWRVVRIWEHEMKHPMGVGARLRRVLGMEEGRNRR
ncbi:MAG: very short patch repair endonuclease [Verrucomicrobia bacterium]|nr:very short patch repair endonuclease [Verrucomicrobiota bacterium]